MTVPGVIQDALHAAGITEPVTACDVLSGGCIHDVRRISLHGHEPVVCKWAHDNEGAACLMAERQGLDALSSLPGQPLVVPRVLGLHETAGGTVLLMEWLPPGQADEHAWVRAGRALATMHEIEVGSRYGFDHDNFIGATEQCNGWHEDWVEFNKVCRLEPQLRWARDSGHLSVRQAARVTSLLESLGQHLPTRPRPSLLHGDLWAGNIMPLLDGRMGIIDPACSIGDGWADIAMMKLFGGIPRALFEAYANSRADQVEGLESRIGVYQLYHLLNHVNLFGGGYVSQAMSLVDRLAGGAGLSRSGEQNRP